MATEQTQGEWERGGGGGREGGLTHKVRRRTEGAWRTFSKFILKPLYVPLWPWLCSVASTVCLSLRLWHTDCSREVGPYHCFTISAPRQSIWDYCRLILFSRCSRTWSSATLRRTNRRSSSFPTCGPSSSNHQLFTGTPPDYTSPPQHSDYTLIILYTDRFVINNVIFDALISNCTTIFNNTVTVQLNV